MEQMGLAPESSHHEKGRDEIVFKYHDALETADNLITFKSVVKTAANRNGLHASFMPKTHAKLERQRAASASIAVQTGQNIFKTKRMCTLPRRKGLSKAF